MPLGNQLSHHRIFRCLVVFAGVLDVELPAGKAGCQTHILAFAANGKAELIGGNQHVGVLAFRVDQANHFNPCRAEGVGDVLARVGRPANHVDFLATQLVNHLLNSGAAGANAGTHWINFALHRVDGHLGARAN